MADYTNSKFALGGVHPENCVETEYQRLEPVIGYEELVHRFLFGVPLVSQIKDPLTGRYAVITPEIAKDIIDGAVQEAELITGIDIFPVVRDEKYPFDRTLYESYGYFQLRHRPVTSITKLSVTPANQQDVYVVPLEWVETAYLVRGQVNIVPMTAAFIFGGTVPASTSGSSFFLSIIGNRYWIPAYWQFTYTSGYPDGLVPRVVNDLIGTIAAMDVLSQLAVTYARSQSHSLGIDGLSQSVSTPGNQIFTVRLQELEQKKTKLVSRIKALYGLKLFATNV